MRQVLDVFWEDGLMEQPNKRGTMHTIGQGNWLLAIRQSVCQVILFSHDGDHNQSALPDVLY